MDLPKPASQIEQSVMGLPLTVLSLTNVHVIRPDTPLEVAVQTLVRQKVDLVEVVEDGCLVGVLSVRDVVTRVGSRYAEKLQSPVREFMTPNPQTLPPEATIAWVFNTMDVGGYRHVPVVQDGRAMGVVSAGEAIRFLVEHAREQVAPPGATTSHGVQGIAPGDADRGARVAGSDGLTSDSTT